MVNTSQAISYYLHYYIFFDFCAFSDGIIINSELSAH